MARKKVVLVIVEGPSDETALGAIFSNIFDKNLVYIDIYHGDITTDYDIKPENILAELTNLIKKYAESMHFSREDFQQVVHIVDMDGAYIPDSAIVDCPSEPKPLYSLTSIQTPKPAELILRNEHKRKKLNRMHQMRTVWGTVPYQVYYMSSNLDHALYGKLNSSDEEKESDAYSFAQKYKNNINDFIVFISNSDFSVMCDYINSWSFIKQDLNSLQRHTNLGLCFSKVHKEQADCNTIKD